MTELALKPCPFCRSSDIDPEGATGIKPEYRNRGATWDSVKPFMVEHSPACTECGATTDGDWNTRAGKLK